MHRERSRDAAPGRHGAGGSPVQRDAHPGKQTLTAAIAPDPPGPVQRSIASRPAAAPVDAVPEQGARPIAGLTSVAMKSLFGGAGVQRAQPAGAGAGAAPAHDAASVHAAAARGIATPASALPHAGSIQRAFGRHDISSIQAHVDADAASSARAMGAQGYATGTHVVFDGAPDLHTAAHEAAHVVQQRAGVHLRGGVGDVGDAHERHADEVADRVVRGESAEALLDASAGGGGAGTAVQRRVQIGDVPSGATRNQAMTVKKVLALLEGPVGSPALNSVLSFLTASSTAHLHIEFETVGGGEHTGESGGPIHGETGIFLGDRRLESSQMLQEALLVDPAPLLSAQCDLTISVRIFLRSDTREHELATTILHELELHAVPAGTLLQRLDFLRKKMGNDPDKVIGMLLQYLAAPDDHRNIDHAVAMVESGGQLYEACRGTQWEGWAKATLNTICNDAQEQFLSAVLKSSREGDLERIEHLQAVIAKVKGTGPDPGDRPEKLRPQHPYRTVNTARRSLDRTQVLEYLAEGVRERRPMEAMVQELGEKYGVPRAESIELYNREIAPQVFAEAPKTKDDELLFSFMESYGVPRPVTMALIEREPRETGGDKSLDGEGSHSRKKSKLQKPSWSLPPPKERAFLTRLGTEDDWTPITNHYVPRQVLAAHAELAPGTWIIVDGYQMRVRYTDKSGVQGASRVNGSEHGRYMVLRFEVRGG